MNKFKKMGFEPRFECRETADTMNMRREWVSPQDRGTEPHSGQADRGPEPQSGQAGRGPEPHSGQAGSGPEPQSDQAGSGQKEGGEMRGFTSARSVGMQKIREVRRSHIIEVFIG